MFQDALFNSLLDNPYLNLQLTGKPSQQVTRDVIRNFTRSEVNKDGCHVSASSARRSEETFSSVTTSHHVSSNASSVLCFSSWWTTRGTVCL